jgi:phosphoglycerol transferase MdoB-like AlkP superfamily enzyme
MSTERAALGSATADPGAIGLSLFGFALFLYGVQFVVYANAAPGAATSSVATIYAVLVAAIGETLAGVLYILRGQGYQASILCGFGLWLFGLYLLLTLGADNKAFSPDAVGWYAIALIVPVAFMAIPSVQHRNLPLIIAFVALIGLLLFLGIGFLSANLTAKPPVPPSVNELRVSGIFAFVAAAALWFRATAIVLAIGKGPADASAAPASAGLSSPVTSN